MEAQQNQYGRMARGGHGIPKVSPGPAMPIPSLPFGGGGTPLKRPYSHFRGGRLLSLWTPHAIRPWQNQWRTALEIAHALMENMLTEWRDVTTAGGKSVTFGLISRFCAGSGDEDVGWNRRQNGSKGTQVMMLMRMRNMQGTGSTALQCSTLSNFKLFSFSSLHVEHGEYREKGR
jgi:hypothetical protein